jgi:dephospho-CoA kinase
MGAQAGDAERRELATYLVDNGGDRAHLARQIDDVWTDLQRRHREVQASAT